MKRVCALLFIVFCALGNLRAADFGALLNTEFTAEGGDEAEASGTTALSPWFSLPLGEGGLFVSARLGLYYAEETIFVPELLRLEYAARFAPFSIRGGRISWQDSSGFTAKGLFDGVDVSMDSQQMRFGIAGFYTGFLYKETANISVSPTDPVNYGADFDWEDFEDTYCAPRRVMVSLYGEFPGLPIHRGNLYAGLLAQFDLSDAEELFHTQYLLLRHTLYYRDFDLDAAGAVELENTEENGVKAAFAISLEGGWRTPLSLPNRLSLGVRWASGESPEAAAFFPVIWEAQGLVLQPGFSGIMVLRAGFEARLLPSLSAALRGHYFLRTDSISFLDDDFDKDAYSIGAEFSGSLRWSPFSDLSFSLDGGIFLPKTGASMRDDAPVRGSLTLGAIFSF